MEVGNNSLTVGSRGEPWTTLYCAILTTTSMSRNSNIEGRMSLNYQQQANIANRVSEASFFISVLCRIVSKSLYLILFCATHDRYKRTDKISVLTVILCTASVAKISDLLLLLLLLMLLSPTGLVAAILMSGRGACCVHQGEVVQCQVDRLTGLTGNQPRVTAAVAVRRV